MKKFGFISHALMLPRSLNSFHWIRCELPKNSDFFFDKWKKWAIAFYSVSHWDELLPFLWIRPLNKATITHFRHFKKVHKLLLCVSWWLLLVFLLSSSAITEMTLYCPTSPFKLLVPSSLFLSLLSLLMYFAPPVHPHPFPFQKSHG